MTDYRSVPPPEPSAEFVVVVRPIDAIEGEMMLQVLRDHDIECRLLGTRNAALIGVGPQATPLRIEVPTTQVKAARALLAELRPPRGEDDEELPRPRKAILAVGCVLLFFGGSHLYARRPWTAAVLAVTQLSAIFLGGVSWPNPDVRMASILSVLALDAIMGARAAIAHNRGQRPSPLRQALAGVAWAAAAATIAALYALSTAR